MTLAEHRVHHHGDHDAAQKPASTPEPVCGMPDNPQRSTARGTLAKRVISAAKSVRKYVKPAADGAKPSGAKDVIYTCPMHPQIRRTEPGNCPICGMTLEPVAATQETGPSAELIDMTRRFRIAAALAISRA